MASTGEPADKRTGYYIAGRDWPAISNELTVAEIYQALEDIDDEDVETAIKTLRTATDPETTDDPP